MLYATFACKGKPHLSRFTKSFSTFILAALTISLSGANTSQAQWVEKVDVDVEAGLPYWTQMSINPGGFHYGSTEYKGATVNFSLGNATPASYEVIIKAYGPDENVIEPLFAKLMDKPDYWNPPVIGYVGGQNKTAQSKAGQSNYGSFLFESDFTNPSNPDFKLPIGKSMLVADIYEVTDGYPNPEDGWVPFSEILEAEGIVTEPDSIVPQLYARQVGSNDLDFLVSALDVFQASYAGANLSVDVIATYRPRATALQKRNLDTKAGQLAKSEAANLVASLSKFKEHTAPNSNWEPIMTQIKQRVSSKVLYDVSVWGMLAADKAKEVPVSVERLLKKTTITHPEGQLTLTISGQGHVNQQAAKKK